MQSSGFSNGAGILAALSLLILTGPTTPIAQEAKEPAAAAEASEAAASSLREEVEALREELRVTKAQMQILKSTIDAMAAESAAQSALAMAKQREPEAVQTPSWLGVEAASVPAEASSSERPAGFEASTSAVGAAPDTGQQVAALTSGAAPSSDPLMVGEVHFNPGSADLTPGGQSKTAKAAEQIKAMEGGKIRVVGYTDTTGSSGYNKHLGLMRADSIAKKLESLGVSRELIEVIGRGEEGIPVPTDDQVAEPLNRCAGIFVVSAEEN
ncbi:MAG TPA: OmpA family protein [Geminicoccaceae bacterium]|nr:OmpA family protein [Geminicoccaceae bacterium]